MAGRMMQLGLRHRRRGSAAVIAVGMIVLVGFMCAAMVSAFRVESLQVARHLQQTQARYAADAGIEWACRQDAATSSPVALAGGTFEVVSENGAWVSTGTLGDARCVIRCQPESDGEPISRGLDSVVGSRSGDDQFSVGFLVLNSTDSPITFNKLKPSWSDKAYFESLKMEVLNGQDYGTAWHYQDEERWGDGETRAFTRVASVTIPAHRTAEILLLDFSSKRNKKNPYNIKDTEVTVDFYNGTSHVGQVIIGVAPN